MHPRKCSLHDARRGACWMLLGLTMGSHAQGDDSMVRQLERVEVTGSRITRIEGESGLPVQTITREELEFGGVQTMQDLMERISANQSAGSSNPALGLGTTLGGFTAASLRGLGSQRTLVLLDGRRLAPYALSGGQGVDLSAIPSSAIERVEILQDGASAVYGSDAIGGVINFVLRKDYRGVELNADYFATEQGGGNNGRASITAGAGDLRADKYNVFVSASYFKQDELKASQRESTKTAYLPQIGVDQTSANSYPANISQRNIETGRTYGFRGVFNPTVPLPGGATPSSCARPLSFPTVGSPYQCRFDFATMTDTIPASEQVNVVSRLTWQVGADSQLFLEGAYYRGSFTQRVSPTPVVANMVLQPDSAYYPAAFVAGLPQGRPDLPLSLSYRTVELGQRVDQLDVDQWNAVAGLQGIASGWDYQFAVTATTNHQVDDYISGLVYESKFIPLLRSGVVNPFGPNTSAVVDLMRATQVSGQANDNHASNYGAAFSASSNVYPLAAGPLTVALGLEGRRESISQTNADFVVGGDVLGGAGPIDSLAPTSRNVLTLFGEVNVPVAQNFEANLAVRYDHYSDLGGTTNPKLTLRWQPSKTVVLRGSVGTGFRAPTLYDLHSPQYIFPNESGLQDPIRCPVTGDPYDCEGGLPLKGGGNPALLPETSRQANVGIVFEPAAGLSTSVDYYWVRIDNVALRVPTETILDPANYDAWAADYVVRYAPDPEYPDLPGKIAYVVQYPTNVGVLETSGIDINVQWKGPSTAIGRFGLTLNGTYVVDFTQAGYVSPKSPLPPSVGTRGTFGAVSRYRQYAQANWTLGAWGATLANSYQSGYSEPCLNADPTACATRHVKAYSVWDLQARYEGAKNATLTLGVRNAFDTPPPLTNQGNSFQVGIDPTYADPRGRLWYLALRYAFK